MLAVLYILRYPGIAFPYDESGLVPLVLPILREVDKSSPSSERLQQTEMPASGWPRGFSTRKSDRPSERHERELSRYAAFFLHAMLPNRDLPKYGGLIIVSYARTLCKKELSFVCFLAFFMTLDAGASLVQLGRPADRPSIKSPFAEA